MMSEAIIAAIAAGVGAVLAGLGTVIVNVIKAKNEPKIKELELGEKFEKQLTELKNSLIQSVEELKESVGDLNIKINNFHQEQNQINIAQLRHSIVDVYENYKDKEKIPLPVYQSTMDLYDKYYNLGGNSFVKNIVKEMESWDKE